MFSKIKRSYFVVSVWVPMDGTFMQLIEIFECHNKLTNNLTNDDVFLLYCKKSCAGYNKDMCVWASTVRGDGNEFFRGKEHYYVVSIDNKVMPIMHTQL